MDPIARLRALHDALPSGGAIMLTREAIGEILGIAAAVPATESGQERDLTLDEAAEKVGRAVSTVRGWCASGELGGAYKLQGRDWRIPPAALQAFLRAQHEDKGTHIPSGRKVDLGSWREVRNAS